jgi:hypothetical protein
MANYYGVARSSYFVVKDPEAFVKELSAYPVKVITKEQDGITLYGFIDADDNGGGDLWSYYDDENSEFINVNWFEVFKRHLQDDWVAIIMECGSEKHRYLSAYAVAYNNKGDSKAINLGDIYSLANNLGSKMTDAGY